MDRLADVLEALHGARDRFAAVRMRVREWRHGERSARAFARHTARTGSVGGGPEIVFARTADDPEPETTEAVCRLWWRRPDHVRREDDDGGPGGPRVAVVAGPRSWSYDAWFGAVSYEGSDVRLGAEDPPYPELLDPAVLLPALDLEPAGEGVVAGRPAVRVRAVPREPVDLFDAGRYLPWGADRYELMVDRASGIVLRLAAFIDGEPFAVTEVDEIEIDPDIPPEVFAFTPPAGEEVHPPEFAAPEHATLHTAAREAPFTVLVPRRAPAGAERQVLVTRATARPPEPATVSLHYHVDPHGSVAVTQTAAAGDDDPPLSPDEAAVLVRDGRTVLVREIAGQAQVLTEHLGTRVFLLSADVPVDTLVEMALSLEPAPADPPPLTDGAPAG